MKRNWRNHCNLCGRYLDKGKTECKDGLCKPRQSDSDYIPISKAIELSKKRLLAAKALFYGNAVAETKKAETEKEKYYRDTASKIADTVIIKQAAYGDAFGKSGKILSILYPEGISPRKMVDALTVVRVIDKLFRIATDKDALGEDPWRDITAYSLLAVVQGETETRIAKN